MRNVILIALFVLATSACKEGVVCPMPEEDAGMDAVTPVEHTEYVFGTDAVLRRDLETYCESRGGTPLEISYADEYQDAYGMCLYALSEFVKVHPQSLNTPCWMAGSIDIIGDGIEDEWVFAINRQFQLIQVLDVPNATFTAVPICEIKTLVTP